MAKENLKVPSLGLLILFLLRFLDVGEFPY